MCNAIYELATEIHNAEIHILNFIGGGAQKNFIFSKYKMKY